MFREKESDIGKYVAYVIAEFPIFSLVGEETLTSSDDE